jgi:hypothetical protein
MAFLAFLGAIAGIIAAGWIVSKITGSKAHFLEDWKLEEGETVLWQDNEADTFIITIRGRAMITSYARPRRGAVMVTNRRIIAGTKPLIGKKKMVQYVLLPAGTPSEPAETLHGGLMTIGYQTFLYLPETLEVHASDKKPFVDIRPDPGAKSSTNIEKIRIYTDNAASFKLPGRE